MKMERMAKSKHSKQNTQALVSDLGDMILHVCRGK